MASGDVSWTLKRTRATSASSARMRRNSNKLGAVFQTQKRAFMLPGKPWDDAIGPDGRVMEVLSEHNCNGWMEGYGLTGRHGLFALSGRLQAQSMECRSKRAR